MKVDARLFLETIDGIAEQDLVDSTYVMRNLKRRRCRKLQAPKDFRYGSNPDGVIAYLFEMRRQVFVRRSFSVSSKRRPGLYIDLDPIEHVDLEGALMLAAEFDRIRLVFGIKPVLDDVNWHPPVRAVLSKLGFYSVTDATRTTERVPIEEIDDLLVAEGLVIIPFVSDALVASVKAEQLRDALFEACEPGNAARRPLYDSLVEAFTNAVQHAYDPKLPGDGLPRVGRWWAGALIDVHERRMHVVVYDQGVGIPATLVEQPFWSALSGLLRRDTDAHRIAAALDYGESSTKSAGRGNGLWQMCELTSAFTDASVCFTSQKGRVTYGGGRIAERVELPTRFGGTMIRWVAGITPREE